MKVLGLDMSTKTGWSLFEGATLLDFGLIQSKVEDFNVNDYPNKSPKYPLNILVAADEMASKLLELYLKHKPDIIVVENSVKGRNRHTQRIIEWIHKSFWDAFKDLGIKIVYMDPSEWRKILEVRLTKDDKLNNKMVNQGKKRGRVTKKHLAIRFVNEAFKLALKVKDNDKADAISLAAAYIKNNS